jgi:hypothetical protein
MRVFNDINNSTKRLASLGIIGACMFGAALVLGQQIERADRAFTEAEAGLKSGPESGCMGVLQTVGVHTIGGKYVKTITLTGHVKGKNGEQGCVGKVLVKFAHGDTLYGTARVTAVKGKPATCAVTITYTGGTGLFAGAKGVGYGVYEVTNEMKTASLEHETSPITVTATSAGYLSGMSPVPE